MISLKFVVSFFIVFFLCDAFLIAPSFCPPIATVQVDANTRVAKCVCSDGFKYFNECIACNQNFMLHQIPGVFPGGIPAVDCGSIYTDAQCEGNAPDNCPKGCTVSQHGANVATCVQSAERVLRYQYSPLAFRTLCNDGGFHIMSDIFCEYPLLKREEDEHQPAFTIRVETVALPSI